MTPDEAIAALDDALETAGETVTLRRLAKPPATGIIAEVVCKGLLRGYAPSDLVPGTGIGQQDQKMILSPSAIIAAGWPGGGGSPVPQQGDRLRTNRGTLTVQAAAGIYMADTLVRIELQAKGA